MDIEQVPARSLVPANYNPRSISEETLAALARGIKEFGLVQPLVVNRRDREILGGHQRLTAVLRLAEARGEFDPLVPVVWVDLDPSRARALNVALNKISGDWDFEKLADVVNGIEDGWLAYTGLDLGEIEDLRATFPLVASLDAAQAPTSPAAGAEPPAASAPEGDAQAAVNALHARMHLAFKDAGELRKALDVLARFHPESRQTPASLAAALVRALGVLSAAGGVPDAPPVVERPAKRTPRKRKRAQGAEE